MQTARTASNECLSGNNRVILDITFLLIGQLKQTASRFIPQFKSCYVVRRLSVRILRRSLIQGFEPVMRTVSSLLRSGVNSVPPEGKTFCFKIVARTSAYC